MGVKFIGTQECPSGRKVRLFNLHLADGRKPTFAVAPGESLKEKLRQCEQRFGRGQAA